MKRPTETNAGEGRRRSAKLLRVLVVGGAVLAASCASVPKGSQDSAAGKSDDKASNQSGSGAGRQPSGGGVSGW